jgi:malate dehydrogenase (oxaloacetate-decarboxylating)
MDWQISPIIARAVANAAQETGVAGIGPDEMPPDKVYERTERYIYEGELAWLPSEGQDYGKLSIDEESLELHRRYQGCIGIYAKVPIKDEVIYKKLYSPRVVADVCAKIRQDPMAAYDYTCKNNLVAIVTDGSAVLGLGNIGPRAALPVMEGKAVLFKTFGGVSFPICIIIETTGHPPGGNIAPAFGG